ncbi:hypothetical protein AGMMS49949_06180 [Alphaproteobacteria bacterium]|nr:hypothetical protein AGMMS49949_06180 [Alphaproteobacteria bacterium]GHS98542.1 hypothetical protein AGMMS50296_6270 [Alphaproteobacteria bacterium]
MALRCALYIRRSEPEKESEKNLTSAENQERFIRRFIQHHEDWEVCKVYHDNGFSAKSLNRPEVKELLCDAESGLFDQIVVYRYDRLTRKPEDYYGRLKMLDRRYSVKIVSATEPFDPTTPEGAFSIGQTILHAELERERTVVRAKDKISSSKQCGLWTGGNIPPGYKSVERKLVIDEAIAPLIRFLFKRYVEIRSPVELAREINNKALELSEEEKQRLKLMNRDRVMTFLKNPIYKGSISHYEKLYKGQHEAIVEEALWDQVHELLKKKPLKAPAVRTPLEFAFKSRLRCKECNRAMMASFTSKKNRKYAYYTCLNKRDSLFCRGVDTNINAELVHRVVTDEVRKILKEPEILDGLWDRLSEKASPEEAYKRLQNIDKAWDLLPTEERNKVLQEFVKNVWISKQGFTIELTPNGSETAETVTIPGKFYNRNHSPQVFVPKENPAELKDPAVLKALVQATLWTQKLENETYANYGEIAEDCGFSYDYVRRTMGLAKLSPKIKMAILDGKLTPNFSVKDFKRKSPALLWKDQEAVFLSEE